MQYPERKLDYSTGESGGDGGPSTIHISFSRPHVHSIYYKQLCIAILYDMFGAYMPVTEGEDTHHQCLLQTTPNSSDLDLGLEQNRHEVE